MTDQVWQDYRNAQNDDNHELTFSASFACKPSITVAVVVTIFLDATPMFTDIIRQGTLRYVCKKISLLKFVKVKSGRMF